MHQKYQNKLLHTCLSPWQHVEANESIRRCLKRFLIAKTSPLADFCGFKHSKGLQKANFIKNCSKIKILKFTFFVCGRAKTFLGQQEHQNKLLHTCFSLRKHVEANESIRRCFKRCLNAKTSPLADFCGFKHSKALQKSNFIKNCSKITILKFTLFVCGRAKTFLGQQEHQNKLLGTCLGPWVRVEVNEIIRRCSKQFLIAKTSLLCDFQR